MKRVLLLAVTLFVSSCNTIVSDVSEVKEYKMTYTSANWNLEYDVRLKHIDSTLFWQLIVESRFDSLMLQDTPDWRRILSFDEGQDMFLLSLETEDDFEYKVISLPGYNDYMSVKRDSLTNKTTSFIFESNMPLSKEGYNQIAKASLKIYGD